MFIRWSDKLMMRILLFLVRYLSFLFHIFPYCYCYCYFSYLVTIMGLVIPWSFTLALVDGYSVLLKCPVRQPGIISIIVVGDWVNKINRHKLPSFLFETISSSVYVCFLYQVLSFLTLSAACSTASVVDLLLQSQRPPCLPKLCSRYQISAAMAFLSCLLSLASSLFNLWILPSLWIKSSSSYIEKQLYWEEQ